MFPAFVVSIASIVTLSSPEMVNPGFEVEASSVVLPAVPRTTTQVIRRAQPENA